MSNPNATAKNTMNMNSMKESLLASLEKVDSSKSKQQCLHLAFKNNNNCAKCDKPITKCDNPTTLLFRCIDRSLSLDAINRLRDLDSKALLDRKKLHLVLDLDNTLIHAVVNKNTKKKSNQSSGKDDDVHVIWKGQKDETLVKLRPGARDFLEKATQLFDLSIYTTGDKPYATEIAKVLESDKVRFSRVISREENTRMGVKSLDIVLSHQRVVLIVDDKDDVWDPQARGNVIKILPYTFFPKEVDDDDQELERVFIPRFLLKSKNIAMLPKTCLKKL